MTTNSPNQVDGEVQALIYRCKNSVDHLSQMVEAGIRGGRYSVTEYRYQLMINKIALAALEAELCAYLYGASFERGEVEGEIEDSPGTDMPVFTTPPAQLLRPVELPQGRLMQVAFETDPVNADMHMCISREAAVRAIREAGYEVKND